MTLQRQKRRLHQISHHLTALENLLTQAWEAAAITLPDGYPTGGSEPVSGGSISDPVGSAVCDRETALESAGIDDRAHRTGMAAINTSLTVIESAMAEIRHECSRLVAPLVRKDPPARSDLVDCQACGRTIAGTLTDRARSGYCTACYTAWLRDDRPDRTQFAATRKGVDTRPQPVRISGATIWINGTTHQMSDAQIARLTADPSARDDIIAELTGPATT